MAMSNPTRIKVNRGEQLLVDVPAEPSSGYEIAAPSAWYGWDYARAVVLEARIPAPPDSVVILTDKSPLLLRQAAEQFARYLRRQFRYDFVQYSANQPCGVVFLWADAERDSLRRAIGAAHFVSHETSSGNTVWYLNWVWFHPFARRKGQLKAIWPYFRERFGRFCVETPLSKEMEAFLAAQDCADWWKIPDSHEDKGDWNRHQQAIDATGVPVWYQLEEDDLEEDEFPAGAFYKFLHDQVGRQDRIGDVADMAYADDDWPKTGGIRKVWEYLLHRGFCHQGFDSLRDAWREFVNDGLVELDEATHRQLAEATFRIEAEMSRAGNILGEASHPQASALWKLRDEIEQFRYRMRHEAEKSGLDGRLYTNSTKTKL
jgi:hypothetical protein